MPGERRERRPAAVSDMGGRATAVPYAHGVEERRLDGAALRERRRQRTSRQIEHAALRLFAEKGYHDVTVEEIAHAAEISERTFFRYFATKDDVILAEERRRMDTFCGLLAAQDPREPAWRAMHNAVLEYLAHLEQDDGGVQWQQITAGEPLLRAKLAAHATDVCLTVIRDELAQRLGEGDGNEMLADVMAQSMLAACRIAYREWLTDPRRSLIELGEEALGAIEQGLVKAGRRRTVA